MVRNIQSPPCIGRQTQKQVAGFARPAADAARRVAAGVATVLFSTLISALISAPIRADGGHDHGGAPAAVAASSAPRFTAFSEHYELVGILAGGHLTLYLDHADDNTPATDVALEFELGGKKVPITMTAPGEYEAEAPPALPPGEYHLHGAVSAAGRYEVLHGDFDLHGEEEQHAAAAASPPAAAGTYRRWYVWAGGGALLLLCAAFIPRLRRLFRRSGSPSRPPYRTGGTQ